MDGEVIRGVGSGDADHEILVHLLGKALGDLDRMYLLSEGTTKYPLNEGLHPLLYQPQETQRDLPTTEPGPEILYDPIDYSRQAEGSHSLRECLLRDRDLERVPQDADDDRED